MESLFRTLAEAQLERERLKRVEAERKMRLEAEAAQRTDQQKDPYEVKLPSGFGGPAANRPPVTSGQNHPSARSTSVVEQPLITLRTSCGSMTRSDRWSPNFAGPHHSILSFAA